MQYKFSGLLAAICVIVTYSQITLGADIDIRSLDWKIKAKSYEYLQFKGRNAVKILNGSMTLSNAAFLNGIIEFDMLVPASRGFSGLRFREHEAATGNVAEEFYIRHHMSGKPDSTQYTPVYNGVPGWQLYHGLQYSSPYPTPANQWIHLKVEISENRADFYIDDMEKVALAVQLKAPKVEGGLSLYSNSRSSPVYFSNFKYYKKSPSLKGQPVSVPNTPETRVKKWKISAPFSDTLLKDRETLIENLQLSGEWTPLKTEENGIGNIAKVIAFKRSQNTVIARVQLKANKATTIPLKFGYSDKVSVYINGRRLYSGTNQYRSRDYRYLGTIGLFDELSVELKGGLNTLDFAVTELFGGWGLIADVPVKEGITIMNE